MPVKWVKTINRHKNKTQLIQLQLKNLKTLNMAAQKEGGITAYSVKTKTKNVPMIDPVIDIKSGRYIATGKDAEGNKMAAIMGKATAEEHVKNGNAKKGSGWEK
jgi:hypothetical protein